MLLRLFIKEATEFFCAGMIVLVLARIFDAVINDNYSTAVMSLFFGACTAGLMVAVTGG